ncbi:uncharacterized protein LOC135510117 [Oncorhynchus masou masou]|uniref:uncharacterized protein LOC135510117 n=1 Tax=Oncorhynchus masou masou TaxID=90313 RepID=UPI00318350D8
MRVYLAGLVGLLLILTADARVGNSSESSFCTETKECLLCDLVCKNDDYEGVRHYDSVKWVSTDKEAHFMDKAIVTTFMRLFKYITRSNKAGINIDKTVPVIVEETKRISRSFVYTLSFVMPSAQHMTPPQCTDDKVGGSSSTGEEEGSGSTKQAGDSISAVEKEGFDSAEQAGGSGSAGEARRTLGTTNAGTTHQAYSVPRQSRASGDSTQSRASGDSPQLGTSGDSPQPGTSSDGPHPGVSGDGPRNTSTKAEGPV